MKKNSRPLLFVSTKAYGDFLIAYRSILGSPLINLCSEFRPRILALNHLKLLGNALGASNEYIEYFGCNDLHEVPAAYDSRRHGVVSASKSIIELRRLLSPFAKNYDLVFDRVSWREMLITFPNHSHSLPKDSKNIYIAYENFLGTVKSSGYCNSLRQSDEDPSVLIVPGSRIKRKIITTNVLCNLYKRLSKRSITPTVLLLDGEEIAIPDEMNVIRVNKDFISLINAINTYDIVVSADSLSAHLGEFLLKKTFVVSPVNNEYWLPKNAYLSGACATFDDLSRFSEWLNQN